MRAEIGAREAGRDSDPLASAVAGQGGVGRALDASDWLRLAATPTFAAMALLTAAFGSGAPDPLCSAATAASPLTGMVTMYLLMSAFHLAPWLKLASGGRGSAAG